MHISPHIPVTYLGYMPSLECIFLYVTHLAIICEVDDAVGYVLAHQCKKCWINVY